ncbi:dnaJ homolog subfamily C member 28 [Synchiropus picturatus]
MTCTSMFMVARFDLHRASLLLVLSRRSVLFRVFSSQSQISRSLKESYRLLQLPDEGQSSPAQIKESYLRLAKLYHPDSGAATADAALFSRVEEAYRSVLAHQSKIVRPDLVKEEEDDEKSRSAAPQHRHYLSYEGVGSGTPSQRERQYQQFRVDRASEQVLNYRQREHERAAAAEGALVERDMRQRSRKIKITQAVERLVEDLIQESMARGDFRNLSGAGKPLNKFEHNPYADPMTHNLNRILIDNGYQPPWVVTQRDIREKIAEIRHTLLQGKARLSDSWTPEEQSEWEQLCASVQDEIKRLNKLVDNYNLVVPMLKMQMVHFNLTREIERAEKAAQQHRLDQQKERQKERQRRKEEKKKANAAAAEANKKKPSVMTWMQKVLRLRI